MCPFVDAKCMSDAFNPSRLSLARQRRGLSKAGLAQRIEVSVRSVSAYEAGDQVPTPLVVQRIATALAFPASFFSGPDLEAARIEGASFRALSTLTAKQRDQVFASASLTLSLGRWIEKRFELQEPNVPQYRGVDPETAAEAVRREWGIGQRPISNVVHMLEAHGVRVFSLSEESREVDAFSFWQDGTPFVFLNTKKSAEHSRMDASHELGHLCLHWGHDTPRGRGYEQEAQAFGSAFLMPKGSVLAEAPRGARLPQLINAKRKWGVSVAALAYRMHALGLLSEWQYRSLFIEISQQGYRKHEPEPIENRETSQVLHKVFAALRSEGLTRPAIARDLGLPVDELNKGVFGLVLTGLEGTESPEGGAGQVEPKLRLL
jgi:Zn-dependent peptidase ImmA (M78 family)/DNA-binding XRE family transcriptional regulator